MRRTILSLCVVSILAWAAGTGLAQGQGQGKEQGGRPADRAGNPTKPGETAKVDVNAPAAKRAPTAQDIEKGAKEKAKGTMEQGQTRGKAAKDQAAGKTADVKGKGQEQQARARAMQAQRDAAKHMERQARLARIRELAVQKGDTKMVAQVDQLIAKENQLNDLKLKKMQAQNQAGGNLTPAGAPLPGAPAQGKVDANKPAENKPAVQTPPPAPAQPAPAQPAPAQAAPAQAAPAPAAPAPEKATEAPKPAANKSSEPKPQ